MMKLTALIESAKWMKLNKILVNNFFFLRTCTRFFLCVKPHMCVRSIENPLGQCPPVDDNE